MLESGADVNAQDKGGLIPLHNASSYGVSLTILQRMREAKIKRIIDCLQSAFSLKICLVLDLIQRDCKPRWYYCLQSAFSLKICLVLDLIQRDCKPLCFSRQPASPLACVGIACSNFAKKNKRLLAV